MGPTTAQNSFGSFTMPLPRPTQPRTKAGYGIRTRARHALTRLVTLVNEGSHPPFFWMEHYEWSGFRPMQGGIPATLRDIESLQHERLIQARFSDDMDRATVTLEEKAFAAVRGGFGMDERRRILETMYLLANGTLAIYVRASQIACYECLAIEGVTSLLCMLSEQGVVRELSEYDQRILVKRETEPSFYFQGPGLREVMEEPMDSDTTNAVTNQHFHAPVGAVPNGNQNTARVIQHNGSSAAEILSLIERCHEFLSDLPAEHRIEAKGALDSLSQEVESKNAKPLTVRQVVRTLANVAVSSVRFTNTLLEIAKKLGFDPQGISHHFGRGTR